MGESACAHTSRGEAERERERERERESQALSVLSSTEPDVGLDPKNHEITT